MIWGLRWNCFQSFNSTFISKCQVKNYFSEEEADDDDDDDDRQTFDANTVLDSVASAAASVHDKIIEQRLETKQVQVKRD